MIKVLYFSNSRVRGGVEEHILSLLRHLDRKDFKPILVCTKELANLIREELNELEIRHHTLSLRSVRDIGAAKEFLRILNEEKPQIVHSHLFGATRFAAPLAKLAGVPAVVATPHLREAWRKGIKKAYAIDRLCYRFVDKIIAVSKAGKVYLADEKKLNETMIEVIPNGVDMQKFSPQKTSKPQGEFRFGVIGRLEPQKGHIYFLQAIPELNKKYPHVSFIIVGEGELRAELEKVCLELGIKERVQFLGYRADIGKIINSLDVVVLPSLYEGMPLVLLEAGAMAKPVIATNVDGSSEVVIDNQTGLLVSPKDSPALKEAMEFFIAQPDKVEEFGKEARKYVEENFSLSKQLERTQSLYRNLAPSGNKILFLTRDIPHPLNNGYRKRNFYLLKALAQRKLDICLVAVKGEVQTNAEKVLSSYCQKVLTLVPVAPKLPSYIEAVRSLFSLLPFSVQRRFSPGAKKKLRQVMNDYSPNILISDSLFSALNIPREYKGRKILYEHNVESVIFRRDAQQENNFLRKIFVFIEYLKMRRFEAQVWRRFNLCIAASSYDKQIIEDRGIKNVAVINNGVDSEYFKGAKKPASAPMLIYTGQIAWQPNQDAVIYFSERIFPLIKKAKPDVTFWVVGANPPSTVKQLAEKDPAIVITGEVEDIRPYLEKAKVVVVPLRMGSGTRLKILEAFAVERAVVSTSIGAEGLAVENNKHLLIADKEEDFAQAVLRLIEDSGLYSRLTEEAKTLIKTRYDWKVVFNRLDSILEQ